MPAEVVVVPVAVMTEVVPSTTVTVALRAAPVPVASVALVMKVPKAVVVGAMRVTDAPVEVVPVVVPPMEVVELVDLQTMLPTCTLLVERKEGVPKEKVLPPAPVPSVPW